MEAGSEGRLANWWNTLRLRMMAYTKLQFPGGERKRDRFERKLFTSIQAKNSVTCQLSLTIKLVLDNIVESLKKKEYKVMVLGCREQEPAGGESLQQVEQFIGCHHGQALQIGRHCRIRRNVKKMIV